MGDLVHPQIMVEGVGVDQHHRRANAGDLVMDIDAIGAAFRHVAFPVGL